MDTKFEKKARRYKVLILDEQYRPVFEGFSENFYLSTNYEHEDDTLFMSHINEHNPLINRVESVTLEVALKPPEHEPNIWYSIYSHKD